MYIFKCFFNCFTMVNAMSQESLKFFSIGQSLAFIQPLENYIFLPKSHFLNFLGCYFSLFIKTKSHSWLQYDYHDRLSFFIFGCTIDYHQFGFVKFFYIFQSLSLDLPLYFPPSIFISLYISLSALTQIDFSKFLSLFLSISV